MVCEQADRKENPYESANILSKLCYWWMMSIYYKGVTRDLEAEDLYEPVHSERSEVLGDQLERTDALIQAMIRRKFANFTVLTIAHRLRTIIDNDCVLVLDAGMAVEFDHPHNLLKIPDGYFTRMVEETGNVMATKLKNAAQLAYGSHQSST